MDQTKLQRGDQAKNLVLQTVQESGVPPRLLFSWVIWLNQYYQNETILPSLIVMHQSRMVTLALVNPKFDYEALIGIIAMGRV